MKKTKVVCLLALLLTNSQWNSSAQPDGPTAGSVPYEYDVYKWDASTRSTMDKEIFQVLSANLPQGETDLLLLLKVILQVNPRLKVGLDGSMITCRYENKIGYDIFRIPVCDFTDSDIDGAVTALLKTLHYAGPYRMFMVEVVKSWYTRQLTIDNDVPIRYLPHDVVSFLLNNETLTTTYPVMTERIRSMLQFLCN